MDLIEAVQRQAIEHRQTQDIGQKDRNAPARLGDQAALGIDHAYRIVLVLVDKGAVGGARQVGLDLIGNRLQQLADDFQGDRIDRRWSVIGGLGHILSFHEMLKRPGCRGQG